MHPVRKPLIRLTHSRVCVRQASLLVHGAAIVHVPAGYAGAIAAGLTACLSGGLDATLREPVAGSGAVWTIAPGGGGSAGGAGTRKQNTLPPPPCDVGVRRGHAS